MDRRILFYRKLCILCLSFLFYGSLSFAQDVGGLAGGSATNRLNRAPGSMIILTPITANQQAIQQDLKPSTSALLSSMEDST